jgi:hypothetical protein
MIIVNASLWDILWQGILIEKKSVLVRKGLSRYIQCSTINKNPNDWRNWYQVMAKTFRKTVMGVFSTGLLFKLLLCFKYFSRDNVVNRETIVHRKQMWIISYTYSPYIKGEHCSVAIKSTEIPQWWSFI